MAGLAERKQRRKYVRGRYVCAVCGKRGHQARNKKFHRQQLVLPSVPTEPQLKLEAAG
jgi:hypothetical protein